MERRRVEGRGKVRQMMLDEVDFAVETRVLQRVRDTFGNCPTRGATLQPIAQQAASGAMSKSIQRLANEIGARVGVYRKNG